MGDLYGIIHSPKGWHFVCNNNRISKFYDNPRNLVMNISVNEKSLEEVFNSGDIFEEGFYIL